MAVTEPVTLAEAKAQCRVEFDTDDDLISSYITAAREYVENFLNKPLVQEDTDPSEDDPEPIVVKQAWKQAILLIVADWYAHRENTIIGVSSAVLPIGVHALLWPDRNVPV